ncbi:MAG: ion transporter [Pseudomonadota bacterium]|nr:ion transporter [Pseudomonadota bacterium]
MQIMSNPKLEPASETGWRKQWFDIIYRHDTPPSRNFDLLLIVAIVLSVIVVMLDSDPWLHVDHARALYAVEWGFTLLFTAEYVMRLVVVRRPLRYALSWWGIIDLLSILPTYLSVLFPGSQTLLVVRILRMLRLFRILKLTEYVEESGLLMRALWSGRRKILLFVTALLTTAMIFGAVMYVVEGPENGFLTIPTGMYWAIVTMATVGYGDIVPITPFGRIIASALILLGYSIIAVPTGIFTVELAKAAKDESAGLRSPEAARCTGCDARGHVPGARHCHGCGAPLGGPSR